MSQLVTGVTAASASVSDREDAALKRSTSAKSAISGKARDGRARCRWFEGSEGCELKL